MSVTLNMSLSAQSTNVSKDIRQKSVDDGVKTQAQQIKEAAANIDAKELFQSYFLQFNAQSFTRANSNLDLQASLFGTPGKTPENLMEILGNIDTNAIGYTGKPLNELSKDEAAELVSKDGFFGVDKTTERIANFVIMGSGDDIEKLKAGRDGMIRGFKEAEKMWGGKLPQISQDTMQKSIEAVDKRIAELSGDTGGNVINVTA
ncbi:hydrogenase-4 component G [Campylobacter mucosalis]|uniref:hydrogenase-4 component G n=1 Tax=Campylobacter mucosalis TaxID=202 RepID=UPI001B8D47EF|nr:hydrogenase-4 component G [Campylobacter mucosalis]